MASVTLDLAASGRCGEASDSDNTPMVAATRGHGFPQSYGSKYRSTVSADAIKTGRIFLIVGTCKGRYYPSSCFLGLLSFFFYCLSPDSGLLSSYFGGSRTPAVSNPDLYPFGSSDCVVKIPAAWKLECGKSSEETSTELIFELGILDRWWNANSYKLLCLRNPIIAV